MKVLFAVSNEEISESIVKKYQKEYKQIISYKNVYYFNAILKELQKDKTYDRIVISEDLEPFSNSNYDVIDKFILERLNEISNETNALEKIPDIIIICTDRRTKSGYVLTKMHEYGIYNALVGTDRKIDAVCELLNRPRNSEEAKEYYQIAGTTVDTSSVDDVTEQEVQNILIHYKRLGKNEDRYTDSFNNIAAQYTDKQLKIIIKCLPINVRAVLEAECPKYQELVTYADETEEERKAKEKLQEQRRIEQIENDRKLKQKIEKEKREAFKKENNKPAQENKSNLNSGIDLLDNKNSQNRMTGNVIIPNNMDIKNERKIYSDEELQNINSMPREGRMGNTEIPQVSDLYNNQPQAQTETLPGLDAWDQDPFAEVTQEQSQPQAQAETLPGLDAWDQDPFAEVTQEQSQPQAQAETLPGLDSWDQDPFADINTNPQNVSEQPIENFTNQAAELDNPVLPGMEEGTLPGLENFDTQTQETETNSLPGLDSWAKDPFDDINIDQSTTEPYQAPETQNYEDPFAIPVTNTMDSLNDITLPGLDDTLENIETLNNNERIEPTLPSIENTENINFNNTTPTIEPQLQMPDVSAVAEIPQEPKRGRGRPRKYPIEPPKPKGKRGRPRKYPLPEETNGAEITTESQALQTVQNSMVEVQETLPPQVTNQNMVNTNVTPVANQNYVTQQNVQVQQQTNNQAYAEQQNAQIQPQVNNQAYAEQPTASVQPQVNNQTYVGQQNIPVQPQINPQYVNQNVEQAGQYNQNSGQLNNQPNQYQQSNQIQTDPLAGFSDLDTSINQNVAETNNLPGLEDWDKDPLEENNAGNDWSRDPFEENTDTLPGIDNSVGYSLENNEDTLSSSVVNPYSTNQYENNTSIQQQETNSYSQQQYASQMNTEYSSNNNYNQYDNFATGTQTMSGFGISNNNESVTSYTPSQERRESLQKIEENKSYSTGSLNSILTRDKKIVAFVGASKSGTSFLVNNLACLFSSIGVKTAILDMTKNKNSYFIYTNNEEELRNVAYNSIENLEKGYAQGIPVDRNLNVYTTIPNDGKDYSNAEAILSTLVQNESLILVDCDFDTDLGYLANAQEIYLVQSMDILTIQPLTAFLRDLKTKGILDPEKLRIVINKETKVRGLSSKAIIGGISFYNDPAMSYMTELFNKDKIKACSIPFDEGIYARYLESIVNCSITISGYNKNFMNSLKMLGNMVYPLLSKQTYGSKSSAEANYGNNFSTEMNNTLNQMKNKY